MMNVSVRLDYDRRICAHIRALAAYSAAAQVLGYFAFSTEVSLDGLFTMARSDQKRVYLPRVTADGSLVYVAWKPGDRLIKGRLGAFEPSGGAAPLAACTLALVPGLLFDPAGRRLGRGRGSYDRTLDWLRTIGPTVGVAYRSQLVERLDCEDHDRGVQWIATEKGVMAAVERSSA